MLQVHTGCESAPARDSGSVSRVDPRQARFTDSTGWWPFGSEHARRVIGFRVGSQSRFVLPTRMPHVTSC